MRYDVTDLTHLSRKLARNGSRLAGRSGRRFGRAVSRKTPDDRVLLGAAGAAAALAGAALFVQSRTRQAEAENPPVGRFIKVDGVRLHYVERGSGESVVLLHGNGSLFQDFATSGLVALAAKNYRVITFERPGYGYSERPRNRIWTPEAQAALLAKAFDRLGLERPVVVGHSWGTLVAMALGLDHPEKVRSLVLLSGYYYPSARMDVVLLSPPAIPVVGDLMRFTVSPILGRMMWKGMIRKLFGPNSVPAHFRRFPVWMALRPGQIRAAAAEAAMMIPSAARLRTRYPELVVPAVIMAGEDDRIVDCEQSERLFADVPGSTVHILPDVGHMIHHIAQKDVMAAINVAATAQMTIRRQCRQVGNVGSAPVRDRAMELT